MSDQPPLDYYDVLQVSISAEPDTIHRVYRLLAQRFHPDNKESGNATRFRQVAEAYAVLSDPEQRAKYDIRHRQQQQERWRLVETGVDSDQDFVLEQRVRLTVLEVLYTKRRLEPGSEGVFPLEIEKLTGRAREHLDFTLWFLLQKKLIARTDNSLLAITADGVEYLERNYEAHAQTRRLRAVNA
jgi:curved DNA-binding protein CbpA